MDQPLVARPDPSEYAPSFARYVARVPEGDVRALLPRQIERTLAVLRDLSEDEAAFRYAPGKWSVKEVVGHVADGERIMVYRALCFARGEAQELPGFDEDPYVAAAAFDRRTLADLAAELGAVRAASVAFFQGLAPDHFLREGVANRNRCTVRALAYIIAGHELHHVTVLQERYLPALRAAQGAGPRA
jgi:hypothetical protein